MAVGDEEAEDSEGESVTVATNTQIHTNDRDAINYALELLALGVLAIDEHGRIWRRKIQSRGMWHNIEPRRAENVSGKGYLRLTLQIPNKKLQSVQAHRVVWERHNGVIPSGMQVNHKDLDKTNNRIGNLELVTGQENIQHSYANGRPMPWYKATNWRGKARITEEQKVIIRKLRASGMLLKVIAQQFNLGITHVQRICSERREGNGAS